MRMPSKEKSQESKRAVKGRNPLTPNRLLIDLPDVTPTIGEVLLNGKPLRHLLSLRIDIPGKGECNHFTTVTARFLSSVRLHGKTRSATASDGKLEFTF